VVRGANLGRRFGVGRGRLGGGRDKRSLPAKPLALVHRTGSAPVIVKGDWIRLHVELQETTEDGVYLVGYL
jgi:hypothetical protein